MKAIQIREFAEEADLHFVELPEPRLRDDEVLIEVKAAGVNYADILMRRGRYAGQRPLPYVPGFEASGVVLRTGRNVKEWAPGQRVMGIALRDVCGCYSERAALPAWLLMPLPKHLGFEEGAAFPEVFITGYLASQIFGRLAPGESVLIHAAAGGVGTAAVQIAHSIGARVLATASSDEKLARVRELGADVLINYTTQDFAEEVRKNTEGKGVHVVFESVGGEVFQKSLTCLHPLGRMVVYGTSSGIVPTLTTLDLFQRSISIAGFSFGALTVSSPEVVREAMNAVSRLLLDRQVRPMVGHSFPLAQALSAHDLIRRRANFGKVVLVP